MTSTNGTVVPNTVIKQEVSDVVELESNTNTTPLGLTAAQIANMQGLQAMFLSTSISQAQTTVAGGSVQTTPLLVFPQAFSAGQQTYMPLYDASNGQISPLLIGGVGNISGGVSGETSPGSSGMSDGDSGVLDLSKGGDKESSEEGQNDEQDAALNLSKNDSGVDLLENGVVMDESEFKKKLDQAKFSRNAQNHTVNQHGRPYYNGRPLAPEIRKNIILLHTNGVRPCEISRQLKVSHGVVSKIMKQFRKTGSINPGQIGGSKPKVTTAEVVAMVRRYKIDNPQMFAWEIKDKLLRDAVCTEKNIPSISSINRIIRDKAIKRENYETDSSDGSEAITPAQIRSLEKMGVFPDAILKDNNDVVATQEMLKELARLAENTQMEMELPEEEMQTNECATSPAPSCSKIPNRTTESEKNNSTKHTIVCDPMTTNGLSPHTYEEMVKNIQKRIIGEQNIQTNQLKSCLNRIKPVATITSAAAGVVTAQAVPIVIEPGRNEGQTMKTIADTVVDNVMLKDKTKDVSTDEGKLTRKRKGTPVKLAPTQTRGTDCEEEDDVLFTESEMEAAAMFTGRGKTKLKENSSTLKMPLIPPTGKADRMNTENIVTLAAFCGGNNVVSNEIVELSDEESDTDDTKISADVGRKEGNKSSDETLARVQILLLNGIEYEIVPIGGGRWISKNEYELQTALKSVKNGGKKSQGNSSSLSGMSTLPLCRDKEVDHASALVSTQDNHVSSSKISSSPTSRGKSAAVAANSGLTLSSSEDVDFEVDEGVLSMKRFKESDEEDDMDDKITKEGCRQEITAELSENDEEDNMVIDETVKITELPNDFVDTTAETCDSKCRKSRRKVSSSSHSCSNENDAKILESLLK